MRAFAQILGLGVGFVVVLPALAGAATLEEVTTRGRLNCGVNAGLAGFAAVDANQVWSGFEVEFCRAVAAAVLGDPALVDLTPLPVGDRYGPLIRGEIDLVARGPAWSFSADAGQPLDLVGVSLFDQFGFLAPVERGVTSPKELGDDVICLLGDQATIPSLDDYARANALSFLPMAAASDSEARQAYLGGQCDAYARSAAELYAIRATFETPAGHVIVSDPASRLPSGPVVREGDDQWADIVRWTLNALLAAEELGVTSANVRDLAAAPPANPETKRLLGVEGEFGATLGLGRDWTINAVAAVGNYGEIFERHIGENTPIGLARGLNALWTKGGLQYATGFR